MEFFKLDSGGTLKIKDEHIFVLPEFKDIWQSDKSEDKKKAFEIFKFLYLYCDFKSPFADLSDRERKLESTKRCSINEDDIASELVKKAINLYFKIELSNPVIKAIAGAKKLLDKMQDYIEEVDFTEKIEKGTQQGKLVHSISEARKTIIEMPTIIERLRQLRKAYEEETTEKVDYRKNTQRSVWRDIE